MTKNELVKLLKISMMNAVRQRDRIDAVRCGEEYGYYHGQYQAYEEVVGLLLAVDVLDVRADDARAFPR